MSADTEFIAAKRRHDVVILVGLGLSMRDTARQLGISLELAEADFRISLDEFDRAYPGLREETRQLSISRLHSLIEVLEQNPAGIEEPTRSELREQVRSMIETREKWECTSFAGAPK